MRLIYRNKTTKGECRLTAEEEAPDRTFYGKDRKDKFLTIAWNRGAATDVLIDGIQHTFPGNTILSLMVNQSFHFAADSDAIVAWQFNREFYCIVDHDKEVSCAGFLFYGAQQTMFTQLGDRDTHKLDLLFEIFKEEYDTVDNIQEDMLRMLLKRLIILVTRLAKEQFLPAQVSTDTKLDVIRAFNMLVENNYKTAHRVSFYAEQLNRSPKTLTNLFALYNNKSPLTIIQDRILLEAKRLLIYTDKSAKEIAYELGFEDAAYFSNAFKKATSASPSDFRKQHKN